MLKNHQRTRTSKSETAAKEIELNKCFALSLACEYLKARDLLALSLCSTSIRSRLKSGGVRTLRIELRSVPRVQQTMPRLESKVVRMYAQSFPHTRELLVIGSREQIFFGLQGAARLKLTRLSVTLAEEEGTDENFLDGLGLSIEYGAFVQLERLDLKNVGPFSPRAFLKSCASQSLQMIRLSRCPTLMDSTLALLVSQSTCLRELSLEECPSLVSPVLISQSLIRLRLAKCFSLVRVNTNRCPNLMILDLPWTGHLTDPPWLYSLGTLRYLSLSGAARLEQFEVERLPLTLSSLDLGCCTKLKAIYIGHCSRLVYLNCSFCVELETLVLRNAQMLEELDLSLLINLKRVEITGDYSLRKLVVEGCDKLFPQSVFCNRNAIISSSSSRFRRFLNE